MMRAAHLIAAFAVSTTLVSGSASGAADAPNFTVRDLAGKHVRLTDFRGKKLLYLTFWATWCKPCLAELKHIRKLHEKFQSQGFAVLAVSLDTPETRAKVKGTVQRYKLKFPVVVDDEGQLVKLYNPKRTLPFSVTIKGGKITGTRATFQVSDVPLIEKEIRDALK